jgi:hypothetical protein
LLLKELRVTVLDIASLKKNRWVGVLFLKGSDNPDFNYGGASCLQVVNVTDTSDLNASSRFAIRLRLIEEIPLKFH